MTIHCLTVILPLVIVLCVLRIMVSNYPFCHLLTPPLSCIVLQIIFFEVDSELCRKYKTVCSYRYSLTSTVQKQRGFLHLNALFTTYDPEFGVLFILTFYQYL